MIENTLKNQHKCFRCQRQMVLIPGDRFECVCGVVHKFLSPTGEIEVTKQNSPVFVLTQEQRPKKCACGLHWAHTGKHKPSDK